MIPCRVCGTNVEGKVICDVCLFPVVAVSSPQDEANIIAAAEQYRREKWANLTASVVCYFHRADGDTICLDRTEKLLLGTTDDARNRGPIWADTLFCRPEGADCTLELELDNGFGKNKNVKVSMKSPAPNGLVRVGLKAEGKDSFRVLLGTPKQFTESDPIKIAV